MSEHNFSGLTEGRIVHYVLENGQHRPAIVTRVWSKDTGVITLSVFTDQPNDAIEWSAGEPVVCETSINYNQFNLPGTWHWIERAGEKAPQVNTPITYYAQYHGGYDSFAIEFLDQAQADTACQKLAANSGQGDRGVAIDTARGKTTVQINSEFNGLYPHHTNPRVEPQKANTIGLG